MIIVMLVAIWVVCGLCARELFVYANKKIDRHYGGVYEQTRSENVVGTALSLFGPLALIGAFLANWLFFMDFPEGKRKVGR